VHDISLCRRGWITSEGDFWNIERKGKLFDSVLVKMRNPRLSNSVFEGTFDKVWEAPSVKQTKKRRDMLLISFIIDSFLVTWFEIADPST